MSVFDTIAVAEPKPRNRNSRFWFKVNQTAQEWATTQVESMAPAIEPINAEVLARARDFGPKFTREVAANIKKVREHFISEIAPLTLSIEAGSEQAAAVLRELGLGDADSAMGDRLMNMVNRAATIKLALFTLDLFGLDKSWYDKLFPKPEAKQPTPPKEDHGIQHRP